MEFLGISSTQIQLFILVFARVATMIAMLPVFGSEDIPLAAKAALSFYLAMAVFPVALSAYSGPQSLTVASFIFALTKEVFIGIVIGFASSFLFIMVQFAGFLIDRQMGLEMIQVIDPTTQEEITFTGQFQTIIFTIVFLVTNAHYFLILAIIKSFDIIPLLGVSVPADRIASYLTGMTASVFEIAIRLSAPVFVVLFISTITLGVIARTVPQINVFFVGLPMKITVGILTMAIALPVLVNIFRTMVDNMVQDIWKLLYLMA
jgi:flagellar biosynthetic protein FliR